MDIQKLKIELEKTEKLSEIAKPTSLPPLIVEPETTPKSTIVKKVANSIFIGKKISKSTKREMKRPETNPNVEEFKEEFVEEVDSDEESHETASKATETSQDDAKPSPKKASVNKRNENKKVFGPMRPPSNYTAPEGYFDQENDRDLPEIMDEEQF